nr:hypothetical protein [Paracoccus sp. S4493]
MPIQPDELITLRDALIRARASGTRSVEYEGKRVTCANDSEMAAALADLERRIAGFGISRSATVRFRMSKGT